ncbi:MAG: hypothetical protein ABJJ53_01320 [Sulfitobacter sp.]
MTAFALLGLLSAMLGMSVFSTGTGDLSTDDEQEGDQDVEFEPEVEPLPVQEDLPDEGDVTDEDAASDQDGVADQDAVTDEGDLSDEDEAMLDLGATFMTTDTGVSLEVGEDETGSLAVIYYEDTEDRAEDWVEVDEARFYLVPEGVDWSGATWETQGDVPGAEESSDPWNYLLEDFEAHFGLELLGVVDLLQVPSDDVDDPASRVGEIDANAPVAGYFLEANTDGDDLISFLPEDYVVTRSGVPLTVVEESTVGSDGADWLDAAADGITLDGGEGDDILTGGIYDGNFSDITLIGGEGDDIFSSYSQGNVTIDAGNGDDSIERVFAISANIDLGSGDDYANVSGGIVNAGDGDDEVYAGGYAYDDAETSGATLFGGAGDDQLTVYAGVADAVAFGGEGDDTLDVYGSGIAHGDAGDDRIYVDGGAQAFGGAGDDHLTVYNGLEEGEEPATLTGGEGRDTFEASVANFGDQDEGVFAIITDFDPDEDVLILNTPEFGRADLQNVTLVPDEDGGFMDVHIDYTWEVNGGQGTAVVRLAGITDLTLDQIDIRL